MRNGSARRIRRGERFAQESYDTIVATLEPDTVLVGSSLVVGRSARPGKAEVPLATVHLSPSIRSSMAPPKLPGLFMPKRMPIWLRRKLWAFGDRFMIDPFVCPPLNAHAPSSDAAGLALLNGWWNSPQLVIGLFPDWFGPKQLDWPAQTKLTGFPLFDERGSRAAPCDAERFLETGPRADRLHARFCVLHGRSSSKRRPTRADDCGGAGFFCRDMLSTSPADLPDGVIHVPYAPFSELLPRCCGLVASWWDRNDGAGTARARRS